MTTPDFSSPGHSSNSSGPIDNASRVARLARAVKRQIGIRSNRIEALWFDIKSGTATRGKAAASKLDLQSDDLEHLTGYQAVNERHLRTVLQSIAFPKQSVFVDIGCGKGKAVLIAADYDFVSRVVGVELAGSLCDDARANVRHLKERGVLKKQVEIIQADAAKYKFIGGENIFFVNNPFDWTLMSKLLDNICNTAEDSKKEIFLLYANPASAEAIRHGGRLRLYREFAFFGPGRNINVYVTASSQLS